MENIFTKNDPCPCVGCFMATSECHGCDNYELWLKRINKRIELSKELVVRLSAQCNFNNTCSSGRATVKMAGFRGGLDNQWNSDKWEHGLKTYRRRSWKNYRATQWSSR